MQLMGWRGIAGGVAVLVVTSCIVWIRVPKGYKPKFDKQNGKFDFLPFLSIYIDLAKFVVGLATGGIVLIVGASALGHSQPGTQAPCAPVAPSLPDYLAAPLFLLATSIFYALTFMTLLTLNYEAYKLKKGHTRLQYIRNRVLAFSGLACFCVGYAWLIFAAAAHK